MRRKRNRKKTDELNCAGSEVQEKQENNKNIEQSPELHSHNENHSPVALKDIPDKFLYPRNCSLSVCSGFSEIPNSNLTSFIESSDTDDSEMVQSLRTMSTSDLLLDCQEESLCPIQQNFYSEEWLKYVKYTATLSQIPSLSVVNGSDVGENVPSGVSTPQELPVLYFSNAVQQPKILMPPVQNPGLLNRPLVTTAIPSISILSDSKTTASHSVHRPFFLPSLSAVNSHLLRNNISVAPMAPNVFPVKLEKVVSKEKLPTPSETNEEILPLISIDSGIESFIYNTENSNDTSSSASLSSAAANESKKSELQNDCVQPSSSDSGNDESLPPEMLYKMEVNFEESESNCLPDSFSETNIPLPSGTEKASTECDGPKIVDILSGNAGGASAFYKGENVMQVKVVEFDVNTKKGKDCSDTNGSLPAGDLLPKVVTQWSIFSMQKTIAVISSGPIDCTIHNLLALRPHIPPTTSEKLPGLKLKIRLREENFLTMSVWWLLEKRFLPLNPPCASCYGKVFQISSCTTFRENLCWICDDPDCGKIYAVKRPKFFERFPHFSMEELLLLTYHWASKSPVWIIVKDVLTTEERIWEYFLALQELCGRYVKENCLIGKIGKQTNTVEASAVKLGKFFILCAYDRNENASRLQALTTEEACNSMKHIELLDEWLSKCCRLITWKRISDEFLPTVSKFSADPSITDIRSTCRHILNASKYLGKTMVQLFQNISHDQLTLETVQHILDEVQWRERRGKVEESAFWNILNEISSLNDSYYYTEAKLGNINPNRYFYKSDLCFQMRWGPYNIGEKTCSLYQGSEITDDMKRAFSHSVSQSTNRARDAIIQSCPSTSKRCANEISALKAKHPICVDPQTPCTVVQKELDVSPLKSQDLLSVKILFNSNEKAQNLAKIEAIALGENLKKEGYLTKPLTWLVSKKLLNVESQCYVCHGKAVLQGNSKFPDGVSWLCQKPVCKFQNRFKRPTFFANFGFKLELIFAIIYHWAVQSDYRILIKSVPMNEVNIISVQRKLQSVCGETTKRLAFKIGGRKYIVEVALVKFSNCFILGAMERETKLSRLQAYSIQTKLHIESIRKTLVSWLHPKTTVVVNSNKYLGSYAMDGKINLVFADKTVQNVNSKKYHTLTISNYLQNHMRNMFGNFNVQHMSAELLQFYLDELMWRERYGGSPTLSFKNIMRDIFAVYETATNVIGSPAVLNENVMLQNAAAYYDIPLPMAKPVIYLERLPDYVIERYTNPDPDQVQITESAEKITEPTEKITEPAEKITEPAEKITEPAEKVTEPVAKVTEPAEKVTEPAGNITGPAAKITEQAAKITEQAAKITEQAAKITEPVEKVTEFVLDRKIKEEIMSDEEVEVVDDVQNSKMVPSSSSSNTSVNSAVNPVSASLEIYYTRPKLSVKKSQTYYSRYSEKCYSNKRKADERKSFPKFQCIECRNMVSEDHFTKEYSCGDCKYHKYSTYCQRAFAQHRSYVLFGRKMVNTVPETDKNRHNIPLTDSWYCSCGFNSQEGNKLAAHLVTCGKTTCYLQIDVSELSVL